MRIKPSFVQTEAVKFSDENMVKMSLSEVKAVPDLWPLTKVREEWRSQCVLWLSASA